MISHALTIVRNELRRHFQSIYDAPGSPTPIGLGNIAEGFGDATSGVTRGMLLLSLVNTREEKTLRNSPNYVRNDAALTAVYQNASVFLNLTCLISATHLKYDDALLVLSRAIRFFQSQNVFTHDSVDPVSITTNEPTNALDRLTEFKMIFDLYSPTMEEANHLWGTLGGKQYPFVMYTIRMLELKFASVQAERGLITEVVSDFHHRAGVR